MALSIAINGVDRTSKVRWRSLVIEKDGGLEICRIQLLDHDVTASAFRVVEGDAIRITQDGVLEFGGEASRVRDAMLDGGKAGGTITVVEARGWIFEANDLVVYASFPSQGLFVTVEALRSAYLGPKGWTNLSPTTGGPVLPALKYSKQTIRAIFDDLTERTGYPWRVNGDRQLQFAVPGSILSPLTVSDAAPSIVLRGMTWERDRTRQATRLFIITGGAGTAAHTETHVATGLQKFFPVNVLPNEQAGEAKAGAASGGTSLSLKGLRADATVKAGDTFQVNAQSTVHTVSADATTDGNGDVVVSFSPPLTATVDEGTGVVFDVGTFVRLQVNGVDTSLTAGVWSFDKVQGGFLKTGTLPTAGTQVKYLAPITSPATIRVWATSTRNTDGTWNYAAVRDAEVQASDRTDFATTKAWGDSELASRLQVPKRVRLSTFAQGVYPWMRQPLSFANRLVTGDYLIQRTVLTDVGLRSGKPRVEIELLEGDAIGRDWTAWFRERRASSTGGSVAAGVGGGGTGTGGGTGQPVFPAGTTLHLAGANSSPQPLTTTWVSAPEAIPTQLGGDGMAGTWKLRVPMYQLGAGTLEARLYSQTSATVLATVTTTATASTIDQANFAFPEVTFTAPGAVEDVILQVRVASGARRAVIGHATVVKL